MAPVFYWGLADQTFALTTACPEVLSRAEVVFSAWTRPDTGATQCHWNVSRAASGWEIRQDQNEQVETRKAVDDVITWLEYGAIQQLELPGRLKVHGALLQPPGQNEAVLILGHGESGKSTLATALFARGWTLLCDDVVFVDCARQQALAAPRRVALRAESQSLLGEQVWQRILATPSSYVNERGPLFHAQQRAPEAVTLVAIVILKNEPPQACLRPVEPVQAVFTMAAYCGLFRSAGLGAALTPLSELADGLPLFELTRGPLAAMEESLRSLGTALR